MTTMCPDAETLMRLVEEEPVEIGDHLKECASCRRRVERARAVARVLSRCASDELLAPVPLPRKRTPWLHAVAALVLVALLATLIIRFDWKRRDIPTTDPAARPAVFQEDSVDDLIKKLNSSSFEEQGKAAQALEKMGSKSLSALQKAVQGDNEQVRQWAEKILKRIEEQSKSVRELIEKLGSDNFEEQGKAAEALKKLGVAAAPLLMEALKSENVQIREWAKKILPKQPESFVLNSLKWLARHQNDDGSWSAEGFSSKCSGGKCSGPGSKDVDGGVTGLALLAFLGAGYSHLSKDWYLDPVCPDRIVKPGEAVKKAQQWCLDHQDEDGCVGGRGMKYMYNHAICALALSEAHGMTGSEFLKQPAQKAIDFIVKAQNPGKGWRYSARSGDNDTSVTAWCTMALVSAELSELKFPKSAFEGALAWLDEVTDKDHYYRVGYTHKGTGKVFVPGKNEEFDDHPALSAAAVALRVFAQKLPKEPALGAVDLLAADLPEWKENRIDFYYWHWASTALFQYDGPNGELWKKWNEPMKNALVPNQRTLKDGCRDGSWDPEVDRWGFEGGRVYATAINTLTLEVYYRYSNVFGGRKK